MPNEVAWQSLATALSNLTRLTHLVLTELCISHPSHPSPLHTIAPCLSTLLSLRKLRLSSSGYCTAYGGAHNSAQGAQDTATYREVSEQLAAALGALTALEELTLQQLAPYLTVRECFVYLPPLTALHVLDLSALATQVPSTAQLQDAGPLVGMLSGMTNLLHLNLSGARVTSCAARRLLSESIPVLPALASLDVTDNTLPRDACTALAAQLGQGLLPRLQDMRLDGDCAELNKLVQGHVFASEVFS